ncbi:hypothetical protein KFU94_04340 [Chloroflexi bacterium TSY]|nr:hypothetical protein [Chloroflexi bacterium TSY]
MIKRHFKLGVFEYIDEGSPNDKAATPIDVLAVLIALAGLIMQVALT